MCEKKNIKKIIKEKTGSNDNRITYEEEIKLNVFYKSLFYSSRLCHRKTMKII